MFAAKLLNVFFRAFASHFCSLKGWMQRKVGMNTGIISNGLY